MIFYCIKSFSFVSWNAESPFQAVLLVPAAPAAPAVGGPPVGLGGPGNLAALNKKLSKSKTGSSLPDPKKRAKNRAKAKPI